MDTAREETYLQQMEAKNPSNVTPEEAASRMLQVLAPEIPDSLSGEGKLRWLAMRGKMPVEMRDSEGKVTYGVQRFSHGDLQRLTAGKILKRGDTEIGQFGSFPDTSMLNWVGETVTCTKCQREIVGQIAYTPEGQVADSSGFMRFDEGDVCDDCLREAGLDPDQPVVA